LYCSAVEARAIARHDGQIGASEPAMPRGFEVYRDHCFFVTNSTSTSNKMVWHANVA
jgi:arginine decarboxylase